MGIDDAAELAGERFEVGHGDGAAQYQRAVGCVRANIFRLVGVCSAARRYGVDHAPQTFHRPGELADGAGGRSGRACPEAIGRRYVVYSRRQTRAGYAVAESDYRFSVVVLPNNEDLILRP